VSSCGAILSLDLDYQRTFAIPFLAQTKGCASELFYSSLTLNIAIVLNTHQASPTACGTPAKTNSGPPPEGLAWSPAWPDQGPKRIA
jgi:hypothetical protein